MELTLGIDFSRYQDDTKYDFKRLWDMGVRFIIAKSSEGLHWMDPTFIRKMETAKKLGFITGHFHWITPEDRGDSQVDYMLGNVPDELIDFHSLDVEDAFRSVHYTTFRDKKTRKQMQRIAKNGYVDVRVPSATISENARIAMERLRSRTTKPAVLYTGLWFINGYAPHMKSWMRDYPVWYASYPDKKFYAWNRTPLEIARGWKNLDWETFLCFNVPEKDTALDTAFYTVDPKTGMKDKEWTIWQFTGDRIRLPGTPAVTEYDLFNGSYEDLVKFIQTVEV